MLGLLHVLLIYIRPRQGTIDIGVPALPAHSYAVISLLHNIQQGMERKKKTVTLHKQIKIYILL